MVDVLRYPVKVKRWEVPILVHETLTDRYRMRCFGVNSESEQKTSLVRRARRRAVPGRYRSLPYLAVPSAMRNTVSGFV
jgi:hypothetical protein